LEQPDAESRALIGHEGKVYGALVLPDERRALSWSQDRTLRVWNLEQPAAEPHVLPGHKGAVLGAQLLPDERLALSWSADRTLRLWDFSTFRELACYFTDASVTTTVSGSSGRHIFIGDALGYVQVLCMHVE
jgi:WD40 repeat protein